MEIADRLSVIVCTGVVMELVSEPWFVMLPPLLLSALLENQ